MIEVGPNLTLAIMAALMIGVLVLLLWFMFRGE
jgi:hypothetical protein